MAASDQAGSGGGGNRERKARVLIGASRLPSKLGVNRVNTSALRVNKHGGE